MLDMNSRFDKYKQKGYHTNVHIRLNGAILDFIRATIDEMKMKFYKTIFFSTAIL